MLWDIEINLPEFNLDSFIELIKKILDDIYMFLWGKEDEE